MKVKDSFLTARWDYRVAKARLLPSHGEELFVNVVGWWWLFLHGVRFQHTIRTTRHKYRVDFARPRKRLIVEVDSKQWHDVVADWERDEDLRAHGWSVLRVKHYQLTKGPSLVKQKVRKFFTE